MPKAMAIALFMALLVAGAMFGIARDLYSRERAVIKGTVVEIDAGGTANKSQSLRSPSLKVRLDSGSTVDVAITDVSGLTRGQEISVAEMLMPWGQVWHQLKSK